MLESRLKAQKTRTHV